LFDHCIVTPLECLITYSETTRLRHSAFSRIDADLAMQGLFDHCIDAICVDILISFGTMIIQTLIRMSSQPTVQSICVRQLPKCTAAASTPSS